MCLFYWQTHVLIASRVVDVPPTHIVAEKSSPKQKVQLKLLLLHYDDVSAQTIITFTLHAHLSFLLCGSTKFWLINTKGAVTTTSH